MEVGAAHNSLARLQFGFCGGRVALLFMRSVHIVSINTRLVGASLVVRLGSTRSTDCRPNQQQPAATYLSQRSRRSFSLLVDQKIKSFCWLKHTNN